MKKLLLILLSCIIISSGCVFSEEIKEDYSKKVKETSDKEHKNISDASYLSIVCTGLNDDKTDFSKIRKTVFLTYDINKKELKKIYEVSELPDYPDGVVDLKNNKVYYTAWGSPFSPGDYDSKAGDCLMSYDIEKKKTKRLTDIHHVFSDMTLYNNTIYAITGGKESNGNIQLSQINTNNGKIIPVSPNDTDTLCKSFSIDQETGNILELTYSDYAMRYTYYDEDTGKEKPNPFFITSLKPDFKNPEVLYTFSQGAYTSLFDNYNGSDIYKKWKKTANNLVVSNICRLNKNSILFVGKTNYSSDDETLKILYLDTKTVKDFKIDKVKAYGIPVVSKDKKGMYISLMMKKGKKDGYYYYNFKDKTLNYLFGKKEMDAVTDIGKEYNNYEITSVKLIS